MFFRDLYVLVRTLHGTAVPGLRRTRRLMMTTELNQLRQDALETLELLRKANSPVLGATLDGDEAAAWLQGFVDLADCVVAADQALRNAETEATHGQTASFAYVMQCIRAARGALGTR